MSANQAFFAIATMARVLGVSTAGYYAWRSRLPSARAIADDALRRRVRTIHAVSRGTYGAPRGHALVAFIRGHPPDCQQHALAFGRHAPCNSWLSPGVNPSATVSGTTTTRSGAMTAQPDDTGAGVTDTHKRDRPPQWRRAASATDAPTPRSRASEPPALLF
jgi:hypothetical protein